VAKTNFTYEKRQKELEKKRKKEEKLKRKQERATDGTADSAEEAESIEGLPAPVEGDSQTETP
jgi:septal ring factor EnvC (AmiA/AmiB activator)